MQGDKDDCSTKQTSTRHVNGQHLIIDRHTVQQLLVYTGWYDKKLKNYERSETTLGNKKKKACLIRHQNDIAEKIKHFKTWPHSVLPSNSQMHKQTLKRPRMCNNLSWRGSFVSKLVKHCKGILVVMCVVKLHCLNLNTWMLEEPVCKETPKTLLQKTTP